jgi:glycogen debranching enzyme
VLGAFALAHCRVYGDAPPAARSFMPPLAAHLDDGCVAEVFEGNAPFGLDGCGAQAWTAAREPGAVPSVTR